MGSLGMLKRAAQLSAQLPSCPAVAVSPRTFTSKVYAPHHHHCKEKLRFDREDALHSLPKAQIMPLKDASEPQVLFTPSETCPHIPGARAFVVDNVLSPLDCRVWIARATAAGFATPDTATAKQQDAHKHFQSKTRAEMFYGDRERITIVDEHWAGRLWASIKRHVEPEEFHGRGSPLNGDHKRHLFSGLAAVSLPAGTYTAHSVSPLLRVSRYSPGGSFKRHCDGFFARDEGFVGFYTVLVYLNDVPEGGGGETRLWNGDGGELVARVAPKAGRALVFHMSQMHEGAVLKEGVKYMVRSEVVFGRTGPVSEA